MSDTNPEDPIRKDETVGDTPPSDGGDSEPETPIKPQADWDSPPSEKGVTAEEIQEMINEIPPEILSPDLPLLLASMVEMLDEQAMRYLGLRVNPVTKQVDRDLQKAKIAIDVVGDIVGRVSPMVGPEQLRDLQAKVSTLQMNFVEQTRRGE